MTKINVTQNRIFFRDSVEMFVGRGENANYQNFLLSPLPPQCFQKTSSSGFLNFRLCGKWFMNSYCSFYSLSCDKIIDLSIHPIRPKLSGTVPDVDTLSWHPGKYEIVQKIEKSKVDRFLRPTEGEGFVINGCYKKLP